MRGRPSSLLVGLVGLTATGRSPRALFGAYRVAGEGRYDAGEVLHFLAYHWAELTLYVGFVPVVAIIVLLARSRRLDERLQAYLAGAVSVSFFFVLVAAGFASRFADRIQERNTFAVAPLFLIALLAWVERGAPRPRVLAAVAAAAVAASTWLIPFDRFVTTSAISDTLMLLPWYSIQDRTGLDWLPSLAFALAVAFCAAFLAVPRRLAIVLPLLVLAYWAILFKPVWYGKHGILQASRGALFQGMRGGHVRDWIDGAVPQGTSVGVVYTGATDRFVVNQNEFFNRSVGPVYWTNAPTPGGDGSETRVGIDPLTGAVHTGGGAQLSGRWFLLDGSIDPDGVPVARDEGVGVTLWRLRSPLLQSIRVRGLYPDAWSGPIVTYERRRCNGGFVAVAFHGDPTLFGDRLTTVVADVGGRVARTFSFPQTGTHATRVRLEPEGGRCVVVFRVTPTVVPARVLAGSVDERRLGTHFDAFRLER